MISEIKTWTSRLLSRSPLALLPVRIRGGIAKGARWTLLPHSAYWRGTGERDVEACLPSLGDLSGACCWDLGAHFGIYTVGLAMAVGPKGQVAAFEPDPVSHARCARHVRMNQLQNVHLFQAAVGDKVSRETFIINGNLGATANHLRYEDEPVRPDEKTMVINTVVLDDLVASGEIRAPVFAKVDVEGHGAKALRGAFETLKRHRPVLCMSFHSHFELNDSRAILEPLGYRCFDVEGGPLTWEHSVFRTAILRT